MNLSKNNLFAIYYKWIYGELPKDVCSFFWGSVLAIGLFPILVVGRLFNNSYWPEFGKTLGFGILAWLVYGLITVMGLAMYADYVLDLESGFSFSEHYRLLELTWYGLLLGMPLVAVGVILGSFLIVAVPISIVWLICKLFKVTVSTTPASIAIQNTRDIVGAIRKKHCTKINWK